MNFYTYTLNDPVGYIDPFGFEIIVIENGPTKGNPIGHTAIGVTDHGVYSYGNSTKLGSSIEDYLMREALRRNTDVWVIDTTPEQDAKALDAVVPDTDLGILQDNCASRANNMLDAAGIPYPLPSCDSCIGEQLPPGYPTNMPGTAGARAEAAGARRFVIPQRSKTLPPGLVPFIR